MIIDFLQSLGHENEVWNFSCCKNSRNPPSKILVYFCLIVEFWSRVKMPLIWRKTLSNIWINFSNIAFPGSRIHVHVSTSSEAEGTINHRTKFGVCLGLFYLSINALIDLSINYSLKCSLCGKSKRKKIKRGVNSREWINVWKWC